MAAFDPLRTLAKRPRVKADTSEARWEERLKEVAKAKPEKPD